MNVDLIVAYLKGETVQVIGVPGTGNEWVDLPLYTGPLDMYRLSCKEYSFRIKPKPVVTVSREKAESVANDVIFEFLFELMTPDLRAKMDANLSEKLGTDQYKFKFVDGTVNIEKMY